MRSSKSSPRTRGKVLLLRGRKLRRPSLSSASESGAAAAAAVPVRTSIERRLQQLKRMFPGGCPEINTETLFQRTAEHIFLLEAKVSLLQNLSTFYGV